MVSSRFLVLCSYVVVFLASVARDDTPNHKKDVTVLILASGVSGIITAQTLKRRVSRTLRLSRLKINSENVAQRDVWSDG